MAAARLALICIAVFAAVALADDPAAIRDAIFSEGFEKPLRREPMLLRDGGAKIVEVEGARYFVAVGVTSVQGETAAERVRQLRVGRVLALKATTEFINDTVVNSEEKLSRTSTVTVQDGVKSASTQKVLERTTVAKIQGVIKAPAQVGSWKSADGQLFFYAIGTKLD